ncbi:MAG: VIT family protein [Burkholderiaceae bacterium]|nr:VIT family protein [Burkholderiaceae bacterium]
MPRRPRPHDEHHRTERVGWLRAAVLGANDGIVSTASLLVGVVAAGGARREWVLVGLAGMVGGAMSMAAGEYVSVSSQRDSEHAELALERHELATQPASELHELASIYVARGVEPALARAVAQQLSEHDALAAHAREELGITHETIARPVQAAIASAASFSVGAGLPLAVVAVAPTTAMIGWISGTSLAFLVTLGAVAAYAGGAPALRPAIRVGFWGAAAMALTALIGKLFGTVV